MRVPARGSHTSSHLITPKALSDGCQDTPILQVGTLRLREAGSPHGAIACEGQPGILRCCTLPVSTSKCVAEGSIITSCTFSILQFYVPVKKKIKERKMCPAEYFQSAKSPRSSFNGCPTFHLTLPSAFVPPFLHSSVYPPNGY